MIYFKVSSLRFRFCYAIYSNKFRDIFRVEIEIEKKKYIYVFSKCVFCVISIERERYIIMV